MNNVSFGSTFKIKDNKQNYVNERKMADFCEKNDLEYSSKIEVVKPAKSDVTASETITCSRLYH